MKITKFAASCSDVGNARTWIKDRTGVDMGTLEILPCEMLEIDGRLFYRQRKETAFYRLPQWPIHPDGDIVCECGCFKFHVFLDKIVCHECNKESAYHEN